ncbi:orange carotenoid protein N-terminal domain-containing protein [Chroococcus sp. FPU101]|uniref:orange carotenoid protein N-terminal domain-containing protein n=1 Tax=Chroococcus sp. FPU101 TaxID=1974212 RepID=UPI001A9096BA|nr:orange carotenoid protein N-terminal domain-containing protein [Chroococcus sp. FPU101]GFE69228.1 Orange carotenoid protein [Chroococcus sp. FPU101]
MVSFPISEDTNQLSDSFRQFGVDEQLAILWFVYKKMGTSITIAAPGSAESAISGGLYNQVKEKSQEEQLQIQRDILNGVSNEITREYGSLRANSKLAFWYFLAQGMDEGVIIPFPEDYTLSDTADQWITSLENEEFQQQITILRTIVDRSGSAPAAGASI